MMFHPDVCTSVESYKFNYPNNDHAIMVIATSDQGDVHWAYFDGNFDRGSIANAITSFVYVNDWKISIEQIKIFR